MQANNSATLTGKAIYGIMFLAVFLSTGFLKNTSRTFDDSKDTVENKNRHSEDTITYLPKPFPPHTDSDAGTLLIGNKFVTYDVITGEETISQNEYNYVSDSMVTSGNPDLENPIPPDNFSDLSLVGNTEVWPFRGNVRINYQDSTGYWMCSGSLIDPSHVITAGHCVYDYYNSGGWAYNIVVMPAYNNGIIPYGNANGIGLHAWSGWTDSGNSDHDIGIIDLDRPVGALTGWFGFGYSDLCAYFKSGTWQQNGYPSEAPYNGLRMYSISGVFDGCESVLDVWYGYEVSYNKKSYKGQSGSGAIRDGSVWAVLSNGIDIIGSTTYDARITDQKFGDINTVIITDTPSTFDLIPLDVNISPPTITAGQNLSSMDFLVHNYSSSSWNGTVNYSIYLSVDDDIYFSDTLLTTNSFAGNFTAKSSSRITAPTSLTMPIDTPAGNYYIGVILTTTDANTSNNYSDKQDAGPITVQAAPCYTLTRSYIGSGSQPTANLPNSTGCSSGQYHAGESLTLTPHPATGYHLDHWTGTDSSTSSHLTMPSSALTATAYYVQNCYSLTLNYSGSGTAPTASPPNSTGCSSGQYHAGESINLTPHPATGYHLDHWTGTDSSSSNHLTMPSSALIATAYYVQDTAACYSLTLSFSGSGTAPTASLPNSTGCSSGQYHAGESINLTPHPATGYHLDHWTGTDSSTSSHLTMPASVLTATAYYVQDTTACYSLTLSFSGSGTAPTADLPNSIGCSSGQYHAGESLTLTPHPATGYHLDHWTGTDSSTSSHLTMPASVLTATAYYVQDTAACYSLTLSFSGSGSAPTASSPNSTGCNSGYFHATESITLTPHPAAGYHLDHWTGTDGSSSSHLTMPAGNWTVTAYYVQDTSGVPNDDINSPTIIGNLPNTYNQDTTNATESVSDPAFQNCGSFATGNKGYKTVWYKFIPGSNGTLFADTNGSSISDTVLAVWSGAPQSLSHVVCDDDSGNGNLSVVQTTLVSGITYYLEVAGYGPTNYGNLILNLNYQTSIFADVPSSYWASTYIERLYNAGITGGCTAVPLNYCPTTPVTRAQMAVFLVRGMHGVAFVPPTATGVFTDVPVGSFGANYIEQLAADGITSGCGGSKYCPNSFVTRSQMAVFLVRAKHGVAFTPPTATGIFSDVPVGSFGADFIEQLAADAITSGCGPGIYCPAATVNRDSMAVFLVRTFNLP